MVELYDPPRRSSTIGSSPSSSPTRFNRLPPLQIPPPITLLQQPHADVPPPPSRAHTITYPRPTVRPAPVRRVPQPAPVSKINLLDLATEVTAVIFRYAHKPKDFHYLLPSGAGPLTLRKYNLPLTVSKEWYRRVRPIYYETLLLTWYKLPDFVENVQRYDALQRYVVSIHVRIVGQSVYKMVKSGAGERLGDGSPEGRVSEAQMILLLGQYIDSPLASFALCLDSLVCIRDLTLRFTECKGGEVSLQTIALIITNLPPSVQNLFLDCTAAKQSALNPYPVHICPIIRRHAVNLKTMFLSCRFLVPHPPSHSSFIR